LTAFYACLRCQALPLRRKTEKSFDQRLEINFIFEVLWVFEGNKFIKMLKIDQGWWWKKLA